jgi:opacity protein-like surface antigen
LGARLNFGLGSLTTRTNIGGRVTFDYFFPDGFDYWQVTGDGIYQLAPTGSVSPYLGGGLGLARSSVDVGPISPSSTDFFLNLIGGLKFKVLGNVRPFAEARFQIGDGSQLVLAGGVLFGR